MVMLTQCSPRIAKRRVKIGAVWPSVEGETSLRALASCVWGKLEELTLLGGDQSVTFKTSPLPERHYIRGEAQHRPADSYTVTRDWHKVQQYKLKETATPISQWALQWRVGSDGLTSGSA